MLESDAVPPAQNEGVEVAEVPPLATEQATTAKVNSSAPISGVVALRISPSKSSVIPAILAPALSNNVGEEGLICKKVALEPTVLKNVGFSEIELASAVVTRA